MTATADGRQPGLHGILLIDKQASWTSHDVVAKARRITGQRKIGHTGTLDPAATGLLVLCLGDATRLVEYMTGHDKRYEGVITLGVTTSTDDAEGEVLARRPAPLAGEVDLATLETQFTGLLRQRPPAFSAVSVAGERSYAAARRGARLDIPERLVAVHSLQLSWTDDGELQLEVHCGAGTYVRSLARDIGDALGCGAHLSALRRLQVGRFAVQDAVTLARLEAIVGAGELRDWLIPADEGIADYEAALVQESTAGALRNGIRVPGQGAIRAAAVARIYTSGGDFLGVGSVSVDGEIRAGKVMQGR